MTAKKAVKKTAAKKVVEGRTVWYKEMCRVTCERIGVMFTSAREHISQLKPKKSVNNDGTRNYTARGQVKTRKVATTVSVTGTVLFLIFLVWFFVPSSPQMVPAVLTAVFVLIAASGLLALRGYTELRGSVTVVMVPLFLALFSLAVVAMYPATSREVRSEDRVPRDAETETTPEDELPVIVDSSDPSPLDGEPAEVPEEPVVVDRDSTPVLIDISLEDLLTVRSRSKTEMTLNYQPKRWNQLPSLEPGDEIKIIPMGYVWISLDPEPSQGKARFIEPYRSVVAKNTNRVAMHPAVYSADGSTVEVKFIITR